ncbi:MAG TPA: hypothetical protein VE134_08535 [Methanomicrobiales archaeon]|nr:hypothetical protein [Methanomicrobiales archaeon]
MVPDVHSNCWIFRTRTRTAIISTVHELVADLHDHLEATASLPVATRPSRYLGEAQAVVEDAKGAPESVVKKRVSQAAELLSHVERTGNEKADGHVERARELTTRILSELNGES